MISLKNISSNLGSLILVNEVGMTMVGGMNLVMTELFFRLDNQFIHWCSTLFLGKILIIFAFGKNFNMLSTC
jgi:hypothetical protein